MNRFLTRQEQWVLGLILALIITGLAVKTWRLSQPREQLVQKTEQAK